MVVVGEADLLLVEVVVPQLAVVEEADLLLVGEVGEADLLFEVVVATDQMYLVL